jgi:hypothetical protein
MILSGSSRFPRRGIEPQKLAADLTAQDPSRVLSGMDANRRVEPLRRFQYVAFRPIVEQGAVIVGRQLAIF